MTDNRPCYTSRVFSKACAMLDIRHIYTRPYTPKTNGKTEHFIQTALRRYLCKRLSDIPRTLRPVPG